MEHNHLFAFPPRHGVAREYMIVGDGSQLRTHVTVFTDANNTCVIKLPELAGEPKLLLEYTIQIPPDHVLHTWPDSIQGFYPLIGMHRKTYANWFSSRGFTMPDDHDFFCRQVVIAPCVSTPEVIHTLFSIVLDATRLILTVDDYKSSTANQLENL